MEGEHQHRQTGSTAATVYVWLLFLCVAILVLAEQFHQLPAACVAGAVAWFIVTRAR